MTDPITEKISEFSERMDKEDNLVVLTELITYLQGITDNEKDPITQGLLGGIIISMKIAKGVSILAKKFKDENEDMKSKHNSLLERFNKLEEKFNAEIARK